MMRIITLGALAQTTEPTRNTVTPAENTLRRPTRSAVRPETMSSDPYKMLYAVTVHEIVARETPANERSISINATLTTEKSRVPMNVAVPHSQKVNHGLVDRWVFVDAV